MAAHSISLESDGFFQGYNINENPSVANSVATAALHFSVSLMPTRLKYYDTVSCKCEMVYRQSRTNIFNIHISVKLNYITSLKKELLCPHM